MSELDHFCAFAHYSLKGEEECKKAGQEAGWRILGLTENVSNVTKLPGGTNENARWETEDQTLLREAPEETGFLPKVYSELCRSAHPSRYLKDGKHYKIFSHVTEAVDTKGYLAVGEIRERPESDGRILKVRWYTVEEFSANLLPSHREGFAKSMLKMATLHDSFCKHVRELAPTNAKFCKDYLDVIMEVDQLFVNS